MYPFAQENKKIYSQLHEIDKDNKHYLDIIIDKSDNYLKEIFSDKEYEIFLKKIEFIYKINDINDIVKTFQRLILIILKNCIKKNIKLIILI